MDKINNNLKNVNINSNNTAGKVKSENEEMLDFAVKMCSEKLLESSERRVPEYNKFAPHSIAFYIPGTSNIAEITVKQDEENYKTQRRVLVGVHHKNSDVLISNYLFKGTKKEVLEYIKTLSGERLNELTKVIKELSEESDKYHSSL